MSSVSAKKIIVFVLSRNHFAYLSTNLVKIFSYHVQKYLFSLCRCFTTFLYLWVWSSLYGHIYTLKTVHVLASEYSFYITSVSGIIQGFTKCSVAYFFQTYPRVIKSLRNLTLLLVGKEAPYMTQTVFRLMASFGKHQKTFWNGSKSQHYVRLND